MISALFEQPNYLAAKKILDASVLRHEAIASNLANIETPHYQRLEVAPTFQGELQRALTAKDTARLSDLRPELQSDPLAVAQTRDGNTVQLESELAELNKNFLEHALSTQLITGNLVRLRLAITGRPV